MPGRQFNPQTLRSVIERLARTNGKRPIIATQSAPKKIFDLFVPPHLRESRRLFAGYRLQSL